jgi:hypothetical protein
MRWRAPWADWGREWLECVDEDDTEVERECMGRKSSDDGSICMLRAVMAKSAAGQRQRKSKEQKGRRVEACSEATSGRCTRRLADDDK